MDNWQAELSDVFREKFQHAREGEEAHIANLDRMESFMVSAVVPALNEVARVLQNNQSRVDITTLSDASTLLVRNRLHPPFSYTIHLAESGSNIYVWAEVSGQGVGPLLERSIPPTLDEVTGEDILRHLQQAYLEYVRTTPARYY